MPLELVRCFAAIAEATTFEPVSPHLTLFLTERTGLHQIERRFDDSEPQFE